MTDKKVIRSGAVTVKVEGAAKLRRKLREVGESLGDKSRFVAQLSDLHRDIGEIALREARGTAPEDEGDLRADIRNAPTRTMARLQSRVPYAGPIHFGWPKRGIKRNQWYYRTAARSSDEVLRVYLRGASAIARRAGFHSRNTG